MERNELPIFDLNMKPFFQWDKQWFLLTAGDFIAGHFNAMTVSWGGLGVMWNRPFIQVVVRPVRYTYEFIEKYDTFTLCAFPKEYHKALQLLGAKSGRDGDKIAEAGLSPVAANRAAAPIYAEAELAFECRKIYSSDFDRRRFLDPTIDDNYPDHDYHRIYYGEVLGVWGTGKYSG